jgi:uncharacterized lipoprotein NlpE involved in copper resistance
VAHNGNGRNTFVTFREAEMKKAFVAGILSLMLVFSFSLIGCDDDITSGNSLNMTGTWVGTISGHSVTVVVIGSGWTLSAQGFGMVDTGTYTMMQDGRTATLYSTHVGADVGITVLVDANTMSTTLNHYSDWPGTYTFTRR